MKKTLDQCPHCGRKSIIYVHSLNVGIVSALRILVDFWEKNQRACKMGELKLTNSQFTNFAHLRYWGFAFLFEGTWVPTREGIDFIYGIGFVMNKVAVVSGNVLPYTHEFWLENKSQPRLISVHDVDEQSYKQRIEYQEEKKEQMQF